MENASQQTGSGDIGFGQSGGGFQVIDSSPRPIWAKINAQPDATKNAYGFIRVNDGKGDGTFPDITGTTETSDGSLTSGNLIAWEVNGRKDVPVNGTAIVQLEPNRCGPGFTFAYAASSSSSWKTVVRCATTTSGTLASAYANGSTVDGVTLATGDRILIKNQTTGAENGIYTVKSGGSPSRASDATAVDSLVGAVVYVSEGTVNGDTIWACTTDATITVGTTATAWQKVWPVVIQDEGTPLTYRPAINFIGSTVTVTDDPANNRTNVTVVAGSDTGTTTGPGWVAGLRTTDCLACTFLGATNGLCAPSAFVLNTSPIPMAYSGGVWTSAGQTPSVFYYDGGSGTVVFGLTNGVPYLTINGVYLVMDGAGFVSGVHYIDFAGGHNTPTLCGTGSPTPPEACGGNTFRVRITCACCYSTFTDTTLGLTNWVATCDWIDVEVWSPGATPS